MQQIYENAVFNIQCKVDDGKKSNTYTFHYKYTTNAAPTVASIDSTTVDLQGAASTYSLDLKSKCTDPESLSVTYELTLNATEFSTHANKAWFTLVDNVLGYTHTSNSKGGQHSFQFKCIDGMGRSNYRTFVLTGEQDYAPNVIGTGSTAEIHVNTTSYTLPAFSTLFSDPEGLTMTYDVTISDTTRASNTDNVLTLTLGTSETALTITVKAKDSKYSQESATGVTFTLNPYKCSVNCEYCTGKGADQCTYCVEDFYLTGSSCGATCLDKFYGNDDTRVCTGCPSQCATC